MVSSQAPPTLASFFDQSPELLPDPPASKLAMKTWSVKLRIWMAKRYWKTRDPLIYLKCLCAEATAQLRKTLQLTFSDVVVAPAKCDVLSNDFRSAAIAASFNQPVSRFLTRTSEIHDGYVWSSGSDATKAVASHVTFIWAATMAVASENLVMDETTSENKKAIMGCIPTWTAYLESIIRLQCR